MSDFEEKEDDSTGIRRASPPLTRGRAKQLELQIQDTDTSQDEIQLDTAQDTAGSPSETRHDTTEKTTHPGRGYSGAFENNSTSSFDHDQDNNRTVSPILDTEMENSSDVERSTSRHGLLGSSH